MTTQQNQRFSPESIRSTLPNVISLARLASAPVLLWLAWADSELAFQGLLVTALASDLLDGWLARRWQVQSRRGAVLDSIADLALMVTILLSIAILRPQVYQQDGWVIYSVVALWAVAHVASLLRYGRLASFHTWLVRSGIFLFSGYAVVVFLLGHLPILLYGVALVCALGAVEHFLLLWMLPQWTPDLQGGLIALLRRQRQA